MADRDLYDYIERFVRIGKKFRTVFYRKKKRERKQKVALLFGINYLGTQSELGGCINDVKNMKKILQEKYNYNKIYYLTDNTQDKPTKANMLKFLNQIVQESNNYDRVYIHYSGHGSYIRDRNNDELDGRDECLIPSDYNKAGFITDDTLNSILNKIQCPATCVIE